MYIVSGYIYLVMLFILIMLAQIDLVPVHVMKSRLNIQHPPTNYTLSRALQGLAP